MIDEYRTPTLSNFRSFLAKCGLRAEFVKNYDGSFTANVPNARVRTPMSTALGYGESPMSTDDVADDSKYGEDGDALLALALAVQGGTLVVGERRAEYDIPMFVPPPSRYTDSG